MFFYTYRRRAVSPPDCSDISAHKTHHRCTCTVADLERRDIESNKNEVQEQRGIASWV